MSIDTEMSTPASDIKQTPPQPPAEAEKTKAPHPQLLKVSQEIDKLKSSLDALPSTAKAHYVKLAFFLWSLRARHAPLTNSTDFTALKQKASSLQLRSNQLSYLAAGVGEKLMHQLFALDAVFGEDIRTERKSLVLRAKALIKAADRLKEHFSQRFEGVHNIVNSQLETLAPPSAPAPEPRSCDSTEATTTSTDANSNSSDSKSAGSEEEAKASSVEQSSSGAAQEAKSDASTAAFQPQESQDTSASASVVEETAEQEHDSEDDDDDEDEQEEQAEEAETAATPSSAASTPAPVVVDEKRELLSACKRRLPQFEIEVLQRDVGGAIKLLINLPGVPQDFVFVDKHLEGRQVVLSGVRFARTRYGWNSVRTVPSGWFEQAFEVPPHLSLEQMEVDWMQGALILSLPKIQQQQKPARRPQHQQQQRRAPFYHQQEQPQPRRFPHGRGGYPSYTVPRRQPQPRGYQQDPFFGLVDPVFF